MSEASVVLGSSIEIREAREADEVLDEELLDVAKGRFWLLDLLQG